MKTDDTTGRPEEPTAEPQEKPLPVHLTDLVAALKARSAPRPAAPKLTRQPPGDDHA